MTVTSALLIVLALCGCYIAIRGRKLGRLQYGAAELRNLAPNVRLVLSVAESMGPTLKELAIIPIGLLDILDIYKNSCALVCNLDQARLLDKESELDFALLHAAMLTMHARTLRLLRRALIERIANSFSIGTLQLYANAAVVSYGEQVIAVTSMLDLQNDSRATTLREHC